MTRSKFLGILAGAVGLTTVLSCKKKSKPSEVDGWDKASNETFQDELKRFVKENHGKNVYDHGKVTGYKVYKNGKSGPVLIKEVQWNEVSLNKKVAWNVDARL